MLYCTVAHGPTLVFHGRCARAFVSHGGHYYGVVSKISSYKLFPMCFRIVFYSLSVSMFVIDNVFASGSLKSRFLGVRCDLVLKSLVVASFSLWFLSLLRIFKNLKASLQLSTVSKIFFCDFTTQSIHF